MCKLHLLQIKLDCFEDTEVNGAAYFATAVSYKRTFLQNLHLYISLCFHKISRKKMLNRHYYRGTLSA
jgi:hypothetical protein